MAQVQHLPLYSAAYHFTRELYRIKLKLPNILKHDLGKITCESSLRILKWITLANNEEHKSNRISCLLLETEMQWVHIRLLFDLRGITEGEFKALSERLSEIEKQARAWLNWQRNWQLRHPPQGNKKPWNTGKDHLI